MVGELRRREIGFTSLHENLDTTTPGGRLIFHVFAALAEFIPNSSSPAPATAWPPPKPTAGLSHMGRHHAGGMDEELSPIGQFARLGRLSIKQLRHYAELGLLVPAYVDEHTGYRYYRHKQARDALSIGLLRSLDVPLAVIAQVLPTRQVSCKECTSGWKPGWPSADRRCAQSRRSPPGACFRGLPISGVQARLRRHPSLAGVYGVLSDGEDEVVPACEWARYGARASRAPKNRAGMGRAG